MQGQYTQICDGNQLKLRKRSILPFLTLYVAVAQHVREATPARLVRVSAEHFLLILSGIIPIFRH